jgi:DNA-binding Lrp family transcriptional regulator
MDFNTEFENLKTAMEIKPDQVSLSLENFIREYMERLEREGVILGLSAYSDEFGHSFREKPAGCSD